MTVPVYYTSPLGRLHGHHFCMLSTPRHRLTNKEARSGYGTGERQPLSWLFISCSGNKTQRTKVQHDKIPITNMQLFISKRNQPKGEMAQQVKGALPPSLMTELDAWDSRGGRRHSDPVSCPQTSTHVAVVYTYTLNGFLSLY